MSLNSTPSANRTHIGFFGRTNAGKSSLVNAFSSQSVSVVSPISGTTTDTVRKSMELLPLGPVDLYDTPGLDDRSELGSERIKRAKRTLDSTDIAILVIDACLGITEADKEILSAITEKKIPYVIAMNKSDMLESIPEDSDNTVFVSAESRYGIEKLKETVARLIPEQKEKSILPDCVKSGDTVILVIPIDESAPKGRLILPQQQTIRELLERGVSVICCRETELSDTLLKLKEKPLLVITDSQAFGYVSKIVPEGIFLTSFSILFARYKGDLDVLVSGASKLDSLSDGDKILISEGCTHHRQCNDIGSVKLPKMISAYSGKNLEFAFTSGGEFPDDLSEYALIVHCGACMLNEREMKSRMEKASVSEISMTNYGTAISKMNGILDKSLNVFKK